LIDYLKSKHGGEEMCEDDFNSGRWSIYLEQGMNMKERHTQIQRMQQASCDADNTALTLSILKAEQMQATSTVLTSIIDLIPRHLLPSSVQFDTSFYNTATTNSHAVSLRLISLFQNIAKENYIGEPVTILEHSWQAYMCACREYDLDVFPSSSTIIKTKGIEQEKRIHEHIAIASLLHDIGHMLGLEAGFSPGMAGCGTPNHEGIGGDFLSKLGMFSIHYTLQKVYL